MNNRIEPQNQLYKTRSGKWALNGIELSSGSRFEVMISDRWIEISIEYDGKGYYAIPYSIRLLKGQFARFIGEWAE